ncbi:hypothetical protein KSF78_0001541 [Schistosoma japonicum]|nr:hypothetical protein KSF78_0001541 [Schistosoma japonicum]
MFIIPLPAHSLHCVSPLIYISRFPFRVPNCINCYAVALLKRHLDNQSTFSNSWIDKLAIRSAIQCNEKNMYVK